MNDLRPGILPGILADRIGVAVMNDLRPDALPVRNHRRSVILAGHTGPTALRNTAVNTALQDGRDRKQSEAG
jgi:hypothetical protein